ncbi:MULTISPECIES: DNA mismatch repair endonuclease MutL [Bacteroidota]|uniref:DNA mismatch repair protein MutL n=1 Tax=Flectobacillus rivi TaxID=2984209 RepID=A0ABT6Z016_9BACT|nr:MULTISPECIES: DNA mismatch repair endonuclease MutL [Bacteroidota]MDI9874473.1 DNA mismatch repair endonuclease MutL [Flectobacillus rivi]NBB28738.1 DNA mismatch repair endonuclease MutL [Cellulophaga sp. BC115SP]
MLDIIQLLPDSIANQIAAGEVVQRPSSVVKELLENSIDAEATQVQLIVREAGKTLIQVIDNGKGMSETDARMCFERHATSKIRTSDDLFKIRTMGFRGEAMASIAAVSQVELKTRRNTEELGTMVRIEASELKAQEAISTPEGTNLLVKNLFYNVPARRNFLKSNPVEMRHIIDEFQRVALANPDIAFSLYHNDAEIYNLPSGKLSRRIVDLFGKSYREQLAPCEEETSFVTVRGFVGKPQFAKKTRGEQFFFANNRFIKNSYLNHAVMSAFEGLMPEGSHPFYVLFIEIDPVHIDINVHPTKTEIKFDDERTVYAIVQAAVRKSMSQHNLAPSLDFDTNINYSNQFFSFNNAPTPTSTAVPSKMNQADFDSERPFAKPEMSPREKSNLSNWNKLYEGLDNTVESFEQKRVEQSSFNFRNEEDYPETQPFTLKSKANDLLESRPLRSSQDSDATTFQIHNRYIISQVKSGMLLIDQRAAYERILYEKFVQYLQKNNGTSQQLLFPSTIKLTPADFHLLVEIQDEVRNLGFDLSVIGHDSFIVNGIPADSPDENEQALIEGLLEQFKRNESELHLDRVENLARSMAKRSAGRFGMSRLSNQEMNTLVEQLFASSNPSYSPSGELTMKILGLAEIANIFQK